MKAKISKSAGAKASKSDATFSESLKKLLPSLEALYKDIHAHPQLSMQETRTAGLAASRLRAAGYKVTTGIGKTGVVGVLKNGDGPIVMLRADSIGISYWLTAGLAILAAGLLVRVFIIFHDCGHGSFFSSRRANTVLGFITGVLCFTPYHHWRWEHALHHASAR